MKTSGFRMLLSYTLSVYLAALLGACASFPPPHANTFYDKDETVEIKLLSCNDLTPDYLKLWTAAFEKQNPRWECPPPPEVEAFAALPVALPILGNLALDFVKGKLDEEASRYTQQFGTTLYNPKFWKVTSDNTNKKTYTQNYYGFEIKRTAKRYNAGKDELMEIAFTLVYGLARDSEDIFWVSPLSVQTTKSKAKVWSWDGAHTITTKVEVGIDATWIDKDKKLHKENIAKFDPFVVDNYDIDTAVRLTFPIDKTFDAAKHLKAVPSNFAGVPYSENQTGGYAGQFWLTVLVTESDSSKTKKYIMDLSSLLDKNKDKIIQAIPGQKTK